MKDLKPEEKAEIILWDWLRNYGEVYFNRKNSVNSKLFKVKGISTEIPDLLLITELFGKKEIFAIEVKNGDKGSNIRQANKIFYKYLLNYILGKTKYFVEDKEVKIDRFLVATQHSPEGHLFGYGDLIQANGCSTKNKWLNKIVPKLEFVRTKDFGRIIIQNYSEYRAKYEKKNKSKYIGGPSIGWLISDIIFNFNEDELKIQGGMKGNPVIQGVSWNTKLNQWGQFCTNLNGK